MKKIFTTLAAMAMVAMAANAEITVSVGGNPVQNGGEIVVTNADFHYDEYPSIDFYEYSAGITTNIECADPVHLYTETSFVGAQVCPNGNCVSPAVKDGVYVVDRTINSSAFNIDFHMNFEMQYLPDGEETLKVTLTDDDEVPFIFTIIARTTDNSAVETIGMENANVAAVYDMQGRRVRDDFRGAVIVVYDNGKALKQIRK